MEFNNRIELAYNFSDDLIKLLNPFRKMINIIYVQALLSDSHNARENYESTKSIPLDWLNYKDKVSEIKENGYKLAILFQQEKYNDYSILDKYINELHIDAIITGSDDMAKYAKEKGIYTIASICKCLTYQDYFKKRFINV